MKTHERECGCWWNMHIIQQHGTLLDEPDYEYHLCKACMVRIEAQLNGEEG